MAEYIPRLPGYMDFTSPENKTGLSMQFTKIEHGVASTFTIPGHMAGWRGENVVGAHPGIVDVALNTTMGWAAAKQLNLLGIQKSTSVEYLDLVPVETDLRSEAKVVATRENQEAVVEGQITNKEGKVLARSTATFAMFAVGKHEIAASVFTALRAGACDPKFV